MGFFWRQFSILFWKNWIILLKHPFLNLLRCFILPVAYGIFLAVAQLFLIKPDNLGIGNAVPVPSLNEQYDGSMAFIWADGTNGTGLPSPADVMSRITRDFNPAQLKGVRQVATPADIPAACPQNFNLFSECFVAIAFNNIPGADNDSPVNYTIRADAGLFHIDVQRHNSDFEQRILPLQWAVDKAIIELKTGVQLPTPMEWPFTQATNEEQSRDIRLSYIRGLRTLLVLALFICFIGIAYQLPGAVASERASSLTAHMKAMGLKDSARIISWHLSMSLAYLPAWVIVGLTWHYRIFTASNVGLILIVHLLLGLSLASWSFFVAAPFGKSPQLAAVVSTFLCILFAILALVFGKASSGAAFIFTIIFPPGYYIFAIRAICGFENNLLPTDMLKPDPDNDLRLLPLVIAAIIDIFLWPYLAVLLEGRLYDPREPEKRTWRFWRGTKAMVTESLSPGIAISVQHLKKTFSTSFIGSRKDSVIAIADLTLQIPKYGIFVLLGSNGAGKSTVLSVIGGLTSRTGGTMVFEGGTRPPRGSIGIVPQKNVLFSELTCYQTLRVWRAIKCSQSAGLNEDIEQLLRDCDLSSKIHAMAETLSGGQRRKLQLAIGLIGNSNIVLVDECTSGVDPLSRRALWRTLTSFRNERTIVFTTHFLDEADLLADHIAILAAPGKLVAEGTPVSLKRDLGEGYSVQVTFMPRDTPVPPEKADLEFNPTSVLLDRIRLLAPHVYAVKNGPSLVSFHLKTRDAQVVEQVLRLLDTERRYLKIASYDILGTSIEDIFLDLMSRHDKPQMVDKTSVDSSVSHVAAEPINLDLAHGGSISSFRQALTILHKRALVARRSWLTPLLTVIIAIAGSTIPLVFITDREQTCVTRFRNSTTIPLYLPSSPIVPFIPSPFSEVLTSPPDIVATLTNSTGLLRLRNVPDNATFVETIQDNYRDLSLGGVSLDLSSFNSLLAWEATSPGINGPALLNLVTNILYNRALNSSGHAAALPDIIQANYQSFPPVNAGTLVALKWVAFFGAAMSVFPAFFSLYVCRERRSSVQAMQLSNGLSNPLGLWIGHLMFDTVFTVFLATVIVIVFATVSNQFHGLGFLWLILVLYGITGALFSYCASLIMASPLAAFAAVAGYQIIMFVLYLAGYLLTLTYAKTSEAGNIITIIHFTLSLVSPVASIMRAALVSVNLFSLLCDGSSPVTASSMGTITRYGGPITYLILYSLILLAILVWVDSSGSILHRFRRRRRASGSVDPSKFPGPDVTKEEQLAISSQNPLRVQKISKSFGKDVAVDNVSFGVSQDTIFALLGPNGAGKTTIFNIIRGDISPDKGDIFIDGTSVIAKPRKARLSLGVCPQFTAIDAQLTVREHLLIYGRLKGLQIKELHMSVDSLLEATGLWIYADRLASKLSGGNQRKMALAVALIGNPGVVLIDEFSTGIDAKMKRDMWKTLRIVSTGKAVVITTHSMEEASAIASKVGIIARRMLAVDTTEALSSRYATYEVHFSCRSREETQRAQELMAQIPGSRLIEDVATRFEVPVEGEHALSLPDLFRSLSQRGGSWEYTVERATLESVFLKVIRENNVLEEEHSHRRWRWWA